MDKPAASRAFAKAYKLSFPLIEDRDKALIREYVGVDVNGFSLPGIVVVAPDRTIALRQVGEAPGDRIYAPQLLQIVDTVAREHNVAGLGTTRIMGGFQPLERVNLRVGGGLGLTLRRGSGDGLGLSAGTTLVALYPLGRHVMMGGLVRGLAVASTRVDLDVALRLRIPVLYDGGEIYAQVPLGASLHATNDDDDRNRATGWNTGLAVGMQFSFKPSLAAYLEIEGMYHRFAGRPPTDELIEWRYTAGGGVCFLF